ncbi:MAG: sensor histidine kinase [Naasia sp.]|nr:sensor histidine kinase [Naasia sp.]
MHESLVEWWNSISLRTKITGVTVLLLTFGLLVTGLGTMTVMRNFLYAEVDSQVKDAAQELVDLVEQDMLGESGPTDYAIAILDADGDVLGANPAWLQGADPDVHAVDLEFAVSQAGEPFTIRTADRTHEWRAVALMSTTNQTVLVALPLETTNKAVARMFTLFLLFGIVVVVLGAVLTRLLVTSAFGPLRQVERTAAEIANGDYSQRLAGATPNTEVGRLNRSLNTMLSRIDRAFHDRARTIEQMRRFVGDASHELRTPLVSLRGYAELYRMGALQTPEEVAQAMDRIEREAIRMSGLVQDLLELARLDETKPLQLSPVALLPLAKDAAMDTMASSQGRIVSVVTDQQGAPRADDLLIGDDEDDDDDSVLDPEEVESDAGAPATAGRRRRMPRLGTSTTGPLAFSRAQLSRLRRRRPGTGLPLVVVADEEHPHPGDRPAPPAVVLGDENKLRQVLTNLLGNAVRFTAKSTPIEIVVRTDADESSAIVEIVDHGDGIPPQLREKIFQRFYRADSSRARDTGGSGLGLAIVSAIVSAHRGTVEVDETPGGGATFRVRLPLLHMEPEADDSTDAD